MRKVRLLAIGAAVTAALGGSTAAFGLPWDLDMADSQAVKGYERVMKPLPEGVVSQQSLLSPKHFVPSLALTDPKVNDLQAPFPSSPESIAAGEKMYGTYCTPCHGNGIELGPVGQPGRVPGVAVLAGPTGVLRSRSDGWVYTTIRHGSLSKIMPPYGYMMTEDEMWSVVHYTRTLDNSTYQPPQPATPGVESPK
jgi:mono/diheme cytochrome c family protein